MTLNFSAGFCQKQKGEENQPPYGPNQSEIRLPFTN